MLDQDPDDGLGLIERFEKNMDLAARALQAAARGRAKEAVPEETPEAFHVVSTGRPVSARARWWAAATADISLLGILLGTLGLALGVLGIALANIDLNIKFSGVAVICLLTASVLLTVSWRYGG